MFFYPAFAEKRTKGRFSKDGRYFTDFTLETFTRYLSDIELLQIEEHWITGDIRPGRGEEKWLNLILWKCNENRMNDS